MASTAPQAGGRLLVIEGCCCQGDLFLEQLGREWARLALPKKIRDRLPAVQEYTERNWAALAREFVLHIMGRPSEPYLTFRDGWIHQQLIDAVRGFSGWHRIDSGGQEPA